MQNVSKQFNYTINTGNNRSEGDEGKSADLESLCKWVVSVKLKAKVAAQKHWAPADEIVSYVDTG